MRQTLRILFTVAFCVLLVSGIGCTRKSRRTQMRVTGLVTANGGPVKHAQITFTPVGGGKGFTDSVHNGFYSVRSRYPMSAGQYDVTIKYSSRADGLGFDRTHTERVTVGPLGSNHIDFHL